MAIRNAIINVMAKTCYKASKSLLRDFGEVEQLQASRKGPKDFVFTANSASQKKLVEELTYARPDYGFLIKGTKPIESKDPKNRRWIIDPLNGSANFLHGIPHWAISIGLEEEGDLVAGAIYDATRDELFWAEKGLGAYLNDSRIRISERRDLSECLIAIGSQPEEGDTAKFNAYLEGITKSSGTTRNLGSGSLNLAYLAAGRFDGFWQLQIPASEIAAGIIIVREAGGYITDLGGGVQMLSKKEILAANARTHHRLLRLIKTIKEEEN